MQQSPKQQENNNGLPKTIRHQSRTWVRIANGWIVGPVVCNDAVGIYVAFGPKASNMWQLQTVDQLDSSETSPRLIREVAETRKILVDKLINP